MPYVYNMTAAHSSFCFSAFRPQQEVDLVDLETMLTDKNIDTGRFTQEDFGVIADTCSMSTTTALFNESSIYKGFVLCQ